MPPKQSTLGKFFGNKDGSSNKAPPRQSTLSFGSKSATKAKTETAKDDTAQDVHMKDESPEAKEQETTNVKLEDDKTEPGHSRIAPGSDKITGISLLTF